MHNYRQIAGCLGAVFNKFGSTLSDAFGDTVRCLQWIPQAAPVVLIYVLKILLVQTALNASAGSGVNNEGIGTGGIILNFLKLVPMAVNFKKLFRWIRGSYV